MIPPVRADVGNRFGSLMSCVRATLDMSDPLFRELDLAHRMAALPSRLDATPRVRPSLREWRLAWAAIAEDVTTLLTEREAAAVGDEAAALHLEERRWSYQRAIVDALLASRVGLRRQR